MDEKKFKYSKEEYLDTKEKEINELNEQIKTGIKNALTSERYIKFLDNISKFHKYSINNAMLIMLQNENATLVSGFINWQKKGVQVNKGEKAIKIIAPVLKDIDIYKKDEKGNYILDENSSKIKVSQKKNVYFKATNVFDISQTDAYKADKFKLEKSIDISIDDKDDILKKLQKVSNIKFKFVDSLNGASGQYNSKSNSIEIIKGLDDTQTISTVIHEVAHSMLHNGKCDIKLSKSQREFEAESVAYVVNKKLGIDSKENNFLYLANWVGKEDISDFEESLNRIQNTSNLILNEFENNRSFTKDESVEIGE